MSSVSYKKRRCEKCDAWTNGNAFRCGNCEAILDEKTHQKRLSFIASLRKDKDKMEAELALPPFRRGLKRFLRILETIYLAFISFIAYLLFWLGG